MYGVIFQSTAVDAVGIFRKSGGKQRINHLKEMIEGDPGTMVFHNISFLTITSKLCSTGNKVFNPNQFWLIWFRCPNRRLFQPFSVETVEIVKSYSIIIGIKHF